MSSDPMRRRRWLQPAAATGALIAPLLVLSALCAATTLAQEPLSCGVPVSQSLAAGELRAYRFRASNGAALRIQSSDIGGTLGLVRLRVTYADGSVASDSCDGVAAFAARAGDMRLEVSQCRPPYSAGVYTVTLQMVSGGMGHCGRPLSCGATATGLGLRTPGEVDSLLIPLTATQTSRLRFNRLEESGLLRLRLYDPEGREIADTCSGSLELTPLVTGAYTGLVSACGLPERVDYRVELYRPDCATGPVITQFGTADATGLIHDPIGYDTRERPIFHHPVGQQFTLVIEARAGARGRRPGQTAYAEGGVPDLQMIVSRPLGNGAPAVCDNLPPDLGGIPATEPFGFDLAPGPLGIIQDLGCRVDDGQGMALGRESMDACTVSDQGFGNAFVDRLSRYQFCAQIIGPWDFPDGDTLVGARVKDTAGDYGSVREIVIRIGDPNGATPTATPTATRTPPRSTATATRTPTRTATPTQPTVRFTPTSTRTRTSTRTTTPTPTGPTPLVTVTATASRTPGGCAGDCDGNGAVGVNELTRSLNIVLNGLPLTECDAADADGNGQIGITDLLAAVSSSLDGCPP
ncbi:MAG: hypothetical protein ACRERC_08445 [Candidatus Binatia bacterium]